MSIMSGGVRGGGSAAVPVGRGSWWTDPELLVRGDSARVRQLLDSAPNAQARLVAAVYRASAHLHRDASPAVRRQLLALDAARYGDRELSARITAVPVDEGGDSRWGFVWATAGQVDSRLRHALTAWTVPCAATAVLEGRAVAVGPSWSGGGRALRVWDLRTGDAERADGGDPGGDLEERIPAQGDPHEDQQGGDHGQDRRRDVR